MDHETYKAARALEIKIDKISDFLKTVERLEAFCQGFPVRESPEVTAQCKLLLRTDLTAQLKQAQEDFASL